MRESNQDGRARGILYQATSGVKVTIWVKTWSQIIKENKHRLEFIRDKLNYEVDQKEAIQHLRENYAQFTKGVIVEDVEIEQEIEA